MDEGTARSCHADSLRQVFLSALLPTLVLLLVAPAVGDALDVMTNITETQGVGNLHTTVTQSGNFYDITGGTRPGGGSILFHSFGDFNVGPGDVANFLNKGSFDLNNIQLADGLDTSNILARVTNQHPSNIFGMIQTHGVDGFDHANLFLINPAGIVFGPNASLNVGGSVSFTTSEYIRLFDGLNNANFFADPASDGLVNSVFTMDPVAGFGFLPAAYGFLTQPDPNVTITVQGSDLSVPSGHSISLVGRKVIIESGTPDGGAAQPAKLSAPMGVIQLASIASPGEFDVATLQSLPNADGTSFTTFESVFLAASLTPLASGSSIGSSTSTVFIKDGQIVLSVNEATLSTADVSSTPPNADTIFLSPGSSIITSISGLGSGSDVQITAGNLNIDGSAITTENLGDGIGGSITADVGTLSLANGASINSNNFGSGVGLGGTLTISAADSVMLSKGSIITTQTFSSQPGGDVAIAAGDVHLVDNSTISTETFGFGLGKGGDVQITADHLTLENASRITTETTVQGEVGGDLLLKVGSLRLMGGDLGGSQILSTNSTPSDLDGDGVIDVITPKAGDITIQVIQGANSAANLVVFSGNSGILSEALLGSGAGGKISIRSPSLDLKEASFITSSTNGIGTDLNGDGVLDDLTSGGGDILVSVQKLQIVEGSTITSSTALPETLAVAGGMVTVEGLEGHGSKAGSVLLSDESSGIISASAAGVPGDLTVNTGTLTITNGAVISTGSAQSGPAGSVGITAGSVLISAGGQIFSRSAARDAGQVTITANELTLDHGSIVTRTFSEIGGQGGDVVLNVNGGTVSLTNGASINSQSETFSNGRAGDITITGGSLRLGNHAEITSSTLGSGNAGTITANVGTLTLTNGSRISSASVGTDAVTNQDGTTEPPGTAGNVTITAAGSFTSDASSIATSAEANHGGDISITAQNVQLSNGTVITANSHAPLEVTKIALDPTTGLPDLDHPQVVGDGNAGSITITSASNVMMQNSSVTTAASQASGGQITINAPEMIQLINGKVVTSVAGSGGDTSGGDISIDPQFVILQNSQILAQAFAGNGGNIGITSNVFLADPASIVDASSQLGISGTVNIQAPVQNVSGELVVLSHDFASAAALLAQQCAARVADGKFSTFVVAAREGLPVELGGFLPSSSFLTELGVAALSGQPQQTPSSVAKGLFPQYDAKPLQLAKLGNGCRRGSF